MHIRMFIIIFILGNASFSFGSICESLYLGFTELIQKETFLHRNLLKKSPLFSKAQKGTVDNIDALKLYKLRRYWDKVKIDGAATFQERHSVIKNYPLEDIFAAPGHRKLRNKDQVNGLIKYIKETNGGNFEHDKILLNLVVDDSGEIQALDLWNAHHRVVAYLKAGHKTISDIPPRNIEILINGKTIHGEEWDHFLSISGVNQANTGMYKVVQAGGDIREGTIAVKGSKSNFALGSRNTLGQLMHSTFNSDGPKIGVYFGTFDPIHEGHITLIKNNLRVYGFDEIIIVPNITTIHKSNVTEIKHRLGMISERIKHESRINLYTGDSSSIIDNFGRNPFFESMTQTYGTYDLYQLIGDDSFVKLMAEGGIAKSKFRKYIVSRRKDGPRIENIDPEKAEMVDFVVDQGISSTQIRNMLRVQEVPDQSILHESVFRYIKDNNLYNFVTAP